MKQTALLTGASAGLGREFASQLAQRGCDLILDAGRIPLPLGCNPFGLGR